MTVTAYIWIFATDSSAFQGGINRRGAHRTAVTRTSFLFTLSLGYQLSKLFFIIFFSIQQLFEITYINMLKRNSSHSQLRLLWEINCCLTTMADSGVCIAELPLHHFWRFGDSYNISLLKRILKFSILCSAVICVLNIVLYNVTL